jgi:hypothetical protein
MATRQPRSRAHAREAARARARIRARRQRQDSRERVIAITSISIGLVVVVAIVVGLITQQPHARAVPTHEPKVIPECPVVPPKQVDQYLVPAGPVDGYCQRQLINAVFIMTAGTSYNVTERGQEIGVMTAIGESGLRVLDYGDVAGPDSRGLFQQRANWGTLAERMDPYTSARLFFGRMIGVAGWNTRAPTVVAHIVQGNANPDYYTPYFPSAVAIVQAMKATVQPMPTDLPFPVSETAPTK